MSSVNGIINAAQNGNVKELSAILSTNPELVNAQDTVSDNHVVLVFFPPRLSLSAFLSLSYSFSCFSFLVFLEWIYTDRSIAPGFILDM